MNDILFQKLQARLGELPISKIPKKKKKPQRASGEEKIYRYQYYDENKKCMDWMLCLSTKKREGYELCTEEILEGMLYEQYWLDFLNYTKLPLETVVLMTENEPEKFEELHAKYRKQKGLN